MIPRSRHCTQSYVVLLRDGTVGFHVGTSFNYVSDFAHSSIAAVTSTGLNMQLYCTDYTILKSRGCPVREWRPTKVPEGAVCCSFLCA